MSDQSTTTSTTKSKMQATKQRINTHIKTNKNTYVAGATCLVIGASVAAIIVSRQKAETLQKITQIGYRNTANLMIIELIERSTPSKPVHLVGTDRYFSSLTEAANETGISLSSLSNHIAGRTPHVKGNVFELLTPAA